MNTRFVILLVLAWAVLGSALSAQAATLSGQYVEARTASVFAGACHYSGEYVADGREAVMAWHISSGDWHGISLSGLSALAVVRADDNLAEPNAQRTTTLYVDSHAGPAQQQALAAAIAAHCASSFGKVISITPTPINFTHLANDGYRVSAPQIAALSVDALPNHECCTQPNLVWYKPLAPITAQRVGYTELASCTARTGGDAWSRSNENSAFYGTFSY